jgi:hypothetical protein
MLHQFHVPADQPAFYRITVLGHIDARLAAWLSNMELCEILGTRDGNISVLSGVLRDQSALMGVLVHLYNRGHCLMELERCDVPAPEENTPPL